MAKWIDVKNVDIDAKTLNGYALPTLKSSFANRITGPCWVRFATMGRTSIYGMVYFSHTYSAGRPRMSYFILDGRWDKNSLQIVDYSPFYQYREFTKFRSVDAGDEKTCYLEVYVENEGVNSLFNVFVNSNSITPLTPTVSEIPDSDVHAEYPVHYPLLTANSENKMEDTGLVNQSQNSNNMDINNLTGGGVNRFCLSPYIVTVTEKGGLRNGEVGRYSEHSNKRHNLGRIRSIVYNELSASRRAYGFYNPSTHLTNLLDTAEQYRGKLHGIANKNLRHSCEHPKFGIQKYSIIFPIRQRGNIFENNERLGKGVFYNLTATVPRKEVVAA